MPAFGKRIPLCRTLFQDFEAAYGDDPNGGSPRTDRGKSNRFRYFTREASAKRNENLDITWLWDESLQSGDNLPEPDEIAALIIMKLQTAMEEMEALTALLEGDEVESEDKLFAFESNLAE